jgi:hypothetical protein
MGHPGGHLDPRLEMFVVQGTALRGPPLADVARPPSDFTIRPFQCGDAPEARRLIETVWHEHFGRHPDPFVRDFIYSRLSDVDQAETVYRIKRFSYVRPREPEVAGLGCRRRIVTLSGGRCRRKYKLRICNYFSFGLL